MTACDNWYDSLDAGFYRIKIEKENTIAYRGFNSQTAQTVEPFCHLPRLLATLLSIESISTESLIGPRLLLRGDLQKKQCEQLHNWLEDNTMIQLPANAFASEPIAARTFEFESHAEQMRCAEVMRTLE